MKLTLTTLVIIEDTSYNCNEISLCYHSFREDPNRAKSEIIAAVNGVYAPDKVFNTIEEIQDTWTERFPNPGSNKNDYTLYLSDPQAQYNKLLRTQQKLRNKKK